MKKSNFYFLMIFSIGSMLLYGIKSAIPCTVFCLQDSPQVLAGKNLDWPIPEAVVFYNPTGFIRTSMAADSVKSTWTAEFASLTVNQLGRNFPMGGINEAGLVIESTAYTPSVFPVIPEALPLNEFEWIQYHLDCCATTEAVIVSAQKLPPRKWFIALHYVICDQAGNVAILEWLDGKLHVYTGENLPYPVQVNNTYSRSLKYVGMHQGFGGERKETNSQDSPERFVRAARMYLNPPAPATREAVFAGLDRVKQEDTQLSIMYDIPNRTVKISTRNGAPGCGFSLKTLAASFGSQTMMQVVKSISAENVSTDILPYELALDTQILELVLEQLSALGELEQETLSAYRSQWLEFQRQTEHKNSRGVWSDF